jgi:arabinose-5-phosphate isomerase
VLNRNDVEGWALEVLRVETEAIIALGKRIGTDFFETIKSIRNSDGRVVITGIGKSAAIAQKIVATLNSTGTPALFMHAADAVHGDLGMIQKNDIVIAISKSGNTPEIKVLAPLLKSGGNLLIAMVGKLDSFLAKEADYILDITIEKEACPNNLAPTTSTTAQLVMGDMLAVCLLKSRGFTSDDFARFHPGGALGKRLYLRLSDLVVNNERPVVHSDSTISEIIVEITKKRLGLVVVVDDEQVSGIVTDGDIRRMLEGTLELSSIRARDIMNKTPYMLAADTLAVEAANLMAEKKISQIVVGSKDNYIGVVHLHDLNREGIIA